MISDSFSHALYLFSYVKWEKVNKSIEEQS